MKFLLPIPIMILQKHLCKKKAESSIICILPKEKGARGFGADALVTVLFVGRCELFCWRTNRAAGGRFLSNNGAQ